MRKLIILLLLPIMSYSQISYKDIMSISDSKQFKKVMIENYYEKNNEEDEGWLVYGYSIRRDSIDGNTSPKWGSYNLNDDSFSFQFSRSSLLNSLLSLDIDEDVKSDYDEIIEDIKKNCTYYDIIEYENSEGEVNDYVCYSCSQSKYKGKIGFMIREGNGYIRHFPNK